MLVLSIFDIFESIGNFIDDVKNLIVYYFDLFNQMINYLPSPFNYILKTFLVVIMVLIVIKVIGSFL